LQACACPNGCTRRGAFFALSGTSVHQCVVNGRWLASPNRAAAACS
jgi:hypothetical protein